MVVVVASQEELLLELVAAVSLEGVERRGVERQHAPAATGLGLPEQRHHVGRDERLADRELSCAQVDVGPPQAEHFAAAHAGARQQEPRDVPAVDAGAVEEGAKRLRRPGLDLGTQVSALLRRVSCLGDVAREPTRDAARHRLRAGSTLAIEPMLHAGSGRYRTKGDGWSIAMVDRSRVAHFEHTVTVTDDGPEVLTA